MGRIHALLITVWICVHAGIVDPPRRRFRVDSSAKGCTGLFWRIWSEGKYTTAPKPVQQNPPWPRNGQIVEGVINEAQPNYLVLDDGLALPVTDEDDKSYTYLHEVEPDLIPKRRSFRVDSSAEGCTGLFWRVWMPESGRYQTAPTRQQTNPPWPRNGVVVEGVVDEKNPNFLVLDNGFALPFQDDRGHYTYLHETEELVVTEARSLEVATAAPVLHLHELASGPVPKRRSFRVDASAEGCTGLFWRVWMPELGRYQTAPTRQQTNPPWPRNGVVVEGVVDEKNPNFLVLDNGLALPFQDNRGRYTYLHEIEGAAVTGAPSLQVPAVAPIMPTPLATRRAAASASESEKEINFLPGSPPELHEVQDVLILGSGMAGLTAAIYMARGMRSVAVVAGPTPGGAMMKSHMVENFPASTGVEPGSAILGRLVTQAHGFGARMLPAVATSLTWSEEDSLFHAGIDLGILGLDDVTIQGRSVIVATGAKERWLDVEGEESLRGQSLHTCAYCDARFYVGRDVCVIGGGDGALEAALTLHRVGARRITMVHRKTTFRGMESTAAKLEAIASLTSWRPYVVSSWRLDDEGSFIGAKLQRVQSSEAGPETVDVDCEGAFIHIGHDPQTEFLPASVPRDSAGFVLAERHRMTAVDGMFVAGQATDSRYQQAVTAAAEGAAAAMDAMHWLDGEFKVDPHSSGAGGSAAALQQTVGSALQETGGLASALQESGGLASAIASTSSGIAAQALRVGATTPVPPFAQASIAVLGLGILVCLRRGCRAAAAPKML